MMFRNTSLPPGPVALMRTRPVATPHSESPGSPRMKMMAPSSYWPPRGERRDARAGFARQAAKEAVTFDDEIGRHRQRQYQRRPTTLSKVSCHL